MLEICGRLAQWLLKTTTDGNNLMTAVPEMSTLEVIGEWSLILGRMDSQNLRLISRLSLASQIMSWKHILQLAVRVIAQGHAWITNPYSRAKMADILLWIFAGFKAPIGGRGENTAVTDDLEFLLSPPSTLQFLLDDDNGCSPNPSTNNSIHATLIPALLVLYCDVENTGAHGQFYEKFSIRHALSQLIRILWARHPKHRQSLIDLAHDGNKDTFTR